MEMTVARMSFKDRLYRSRGAILDAILLVRSRTVCHFAVLCRNNNNSVVDVVSLYSLKM